MEVVDDMDDAIRNMVQTQTCCFTGHRPEKLGNDTGEIINLLDKEIEKAIQDGYICFISGMSKGIDLIAARLVIEQKNQDKRIKLICASPYMGFEKSWSDTDKEEYRTILEQADDVKYICEHCFRGCFQIRNKWMVDNSSRVIAAFNGEKGGTKNTIDYALKKKVPVYNILNE